MRIGIVDAQATTHIDYLERYASILEMFLKLVDAFTQHLVRSKIEQLRAYVEVKPHEIHIGQ